MQASNLSELYASVWAEQKDSPIEFTGKEKEIYTSIVWLNEHIKTFHARKLSLALNRHPEIACSFAEYPNCAHLRLRNNTTVRRRLLEGGESKGYISHYQLRIIHGSTNYIVYFNIALTPTAHIFLDWVKKDSLTCVKDRPVDRVISLLAGEDLYIDG